MNLPSIEERMLAILKLTAIEQRQCRKCNAQLYFLQHGNGKIAPYTADGVNHFINCPAASDFRRKAAHS